MRWCRIKMNEIATKITKGTTPTTLGYSFRETGIAFLRVQNLADGKVNVKDDALFIDNATHSALERSQIQRGDLLVSIAGTIGRVAIVESDSAMNCNQAVAILRLKGKINKRYVLNWLGTPDARRQMAAKGVTGTITNLSLGQIKSLEIPLPPLAEQRRIAAILDEADGLRTRRRASLAELDTLLQSTFLQMFGDPVTNPMGWEVVRFEDVGHCRLGKMLDKGKQSNGHQFPYLANYNVQWGRFRMESMRTMAFSEADRREFALEIGDILVCEGGEVGRCAIWRGEAGDIYFQKALHRVRINPEVTVPEFVQYFMWFMASNGGFKDFTNTATIAHLTGVKLKKLPFPRPPLALQREFAAIVESVEAQKARMRAHLAELDTLFAALQAAAFQGEL